MKLDFSTFADGYKLDKGGNPNWATSFGQGREYKIKDDIDDLDELLKGLIYKSVSPAKVSSSFGKGGRKVTGADENSPIVLGSVFDKVYFNGRQITNHKFILLVTKDDSESHAGRLRLKYGPKNTYTLRGIEYTNSEFFSAMKRQLGASEDACWFVSEINIANQDELHFRGAFVDRNKGRHYPSSVEQKSDWAQYERIGLYSEQSFRDGENIILYGVPGCGKSYTIAKEYCHNEEYMERVVFHPDYTYTDFVGQILPRCSEGKVSYDFVPGSFTRILKKATHDPSNKYYLVIEEINRGNAAAIFGDIFQLLDRTDGVSKYGVSNEQIANEVYGEADALVKLPGNLTILATMNTSDQNVFTLDNAFKRRWKMRNITSNVLECPFANERLCDSDITWASFVTTINKLIISSSKDSIGNEDKRLGAYFIQKEDVKSVDFFSEKVLMYLWNDAFKYNRELIFKTEYETLEDILHQFKKIKFKVFADSVKFQ